MYVDISLNIAILANMLSSTHDFNFYVHFPPFNLHIIWIILLIKYFKILVCLKWIKLYIYIWYYHYNLDIYQNYPFNPRNIIIFII